MHYVAIRDETAEQTFLNLVKIGADRGEVPMDRIHMYDLLQLDRSTNWLSPPARSSFSANKVRVLESRTAGKQGGR